MGCPLPAPLPTDGGTEAGASDAPETDGEVGTPTTDAATDALTTDSDATEAAESSSMGGDDGPTDADAPDAGEAGDSSASMSPDAGDADADAAEVWPTSTKCGDGIADPLSEECDDGQGSTTTGLRRTCSSDCRAIDVAAAIDMPGGAGKPLQGRTLGNGRHTLAGNELGLSVVTVEQELSPPRLSIASFELGGLALDPPTIVAQNPSTLIGSDPVIARAPGSGDVYIAYTDQSVGMMAVGAAYGDGNELGVALWKVTPGVAPTGLPQHANGSTDFSQFGPDMVWAGSALVVAWTDTAIGSQVHYRRFDGSLRALDMSDVRLSDPTANATNVALGARASDGAWAAAWLSASGGNVQLAANGNGASWLSEALLGGPSTAKPAIAPLDARHWLAVMVSETAPGGGLGANELRAVILDESAPGAVTTTVLPTVANPALEVNLVSFEGKLLLAWRESASAGDPNAEELFLRPLSWSVSGGLDTTAAAMPMPRTSAHQLGDQRLPGLAPMRWWPEGPMLGMAWDDYGGSVVGSGFMESVIVEIPAWPVRRVL
jgi:hypothetical protein